MTKFNKATTVAIVILLVGAFYWFEYRPAQIKHHCSWVAKHTDAVMERRGKTAQELKDDGLLDICPDEPIQYDGETSFEYTRRLIYSDHHTCEQKNAQIINKIKPQKFIPAKDRMEKATDDEYKFCLRDNGV